MRSISGHFSALVGLLALSVAPGAIASSHCSMNSNKPCPDAGKLRSKEPAYKSMNSNKPAAALAGSAGPAASGIKSAEGTTPQPARASLSGISGNQLKLKPKPAPTSEKEPAK
jgi:hypothetical protein